MDRLGEFLQECHAVRARKVEAITGLRQRAKETGLTLARMRLAAEAADVDIVADGKELKVIAVSYGGPK
jgi:hypothetical protein